MLAPSSPMPQSASDRESSRVDRQSIFFGDKVEDGLAVADGIIAVNDIGQLAARCLRGVENMLVMERHVGEPQEGVHLQAIAVVVGDTK